MSKYTESRKLTCQLTEHELLERGNEMAKTYMQVTALDLEKKRISAKIKPLDERIEQLVVIIDTKEEERDTECRWVFNWATGIKRLYRTDTGLELDSREIRAHERQQQFELEMNDGLALAAEEPQPDPENVCYNTGCLQFDADTENHCRSLQYTSDCDNPTGTGAPQEETTNAGSETAEEAEGSAAGNEVVGSAVGGGAAAQLTLCATCVGLCGDYTPGTTVSECPSFDCEPSAEQVAWRDSICGVEWRECGYKEKCFGPAGEENPDCLKLLAEEKPDIFAQVKANRAAGMDLHEAVAEASKNIPPEFACKICGFDGKSLVYLKRHLNDAHGLAWVTYKKQYPAKVNPDTLNAMREKRAKLIKGAK